MKKIKSCLILTLIISSSIIVYLINKKEYLSTDDIIGVYVNDELSDKIPSKDEVIFQKAICDNDINYYWDIDNWGLFISNLSKKIKCNLYFVTYSNDTVFDFDYTGNEQTFIAQVSGTYRLETWGAQGGNNYSEEGSNGGYGGYSSGMYHMQENDSLNIVVGGQGSSNITGGYNGGGNGGIGYENYGNGSGGGGATHIAIKSGLLSTLENFKDQILIVSGGGGGNNHCLYYGGSGGGISGNKSKTNTTTDDIENSASQTTGYSFGLGQNGNNKTEYVSCGAEGNSGGGGGFYGGFSMKNNLNATGGGGSGYIGNSHLTTKTMYCYNCEESSEENTKTISTTCCEETPTTNCSKKGNGYARITLISIDE